MNLNKAKEAYERLQNERRNLSKEIANVIEENGTGPFSDGSMRIVFPEEFMKSCSMVPPKLLKTYDNGVVYEIQKDSCEEEEVCPEYAIDLLGEYDCYLKQKEFFKSWSKNVDSNLTVYYKAEQKLMESLNEYIDLFGRDTEGRNDNISKVIEFEYWIDKWYNVSTYEGPIRMSGIGWNELGNILVMDDSGRWLKLGLCKDIGEVFRAIAKYISIIHGMKKATTKQPAENASRADVPEGSPVLCGCSSDAKGMCNN